MKAQAVIARSNLYRRLAAGEQAGKIMEEVSGEVTGKNTDRNSGGEYSFILDGTLSPGHLSQIWEMMKKADTLQENKNAADATAGPGAYLSGRTEAGAVSPDQQRNDQGWGGGFS